MILMFLLILSLALAFALLDMAMKLLLVLSILLLIIFSVVYIVLRSKDFFEKYNYAENWKKYGAMILRVVLLIEISENIITMILCMAYFLLK